MCVTFGCEIWDGFTVTSVDPVSPTLVKISGSLSSNEKRTVTAKGAVICAGPWANKVLKQLE